MVKWMSEENNDQVIILPLQIKTVGQLKHFLKNYDDNTELVIQMYDDEYDRIGYIDEISDKNTKDDQYRKYLPSENTLKLGCKHSCIHSEY